MNNCSRIRKSLFGRGMVAMTAMSLTLLFGSAASGQLEITEVMFDPDDDGAWEWFEIRNTGGTAIDLDGTFMDHLEDSQIPITGSANIDSGVALNTVIPAGGVAVLYDGFLSSNHPGNYHDPTFRSAWGLDVGVPLIAVDFFPGLTNGGTGTGKTFGLWASRADYDADLVDPGDGNLIVGSFSNAYLSFDYRNGFPGGNDSASMTWNGTAPNSDGSNWALSENGVGGAVTSVAATVVGGQINSSNDVGNPGIIPGGSAAAGLLITEIMYNANSPENDWEWVEVYNNTGGAIDFGTTPHILSDDDDNLVAFNITSGVIGDGEVAVLFNGGDITEQNMEEAWDDAGDGTNFIAVTDFAQFGNSGDTVALWDDLAGYTDDMTNNVLDNVVSSVSYDDEGDWPVDNNSASIFLLALNADPNDGTQWRLSDPFGIDDIGSFTPEAVIGDLAVHAGGDIGSPGTFDASIPGDFDGDGDVDGDDFLEWQTGFGTIYDGDDFLVWQQNFPTPGGGNGSGAVPEPTALVLLTLLGLAAMAVRYQNG